MKVDRKEFLAVLTLVQPGIASKGAIEQADDYVFEDGHVITFNDEVAVRHPLPEAIIDLHGAVHAKELFSLLTKIRSKEVDVVINKNELQINTKRSKSGILFDSEVKLPLEEMTVPEKWLKLPDNFIEAIATCSETTIKDMTAPALTCIHFHNGVAEATDNYRITRFLFKEKTAFKKKLLVPAMFLRSITNYTPTKYAHVDEWVHFATKDGVIYSCRTFDDDFPDVAPFMKFDGNEFEFPKAVLEIVERASIFSNKEGVVQGGLINLVIEDNWLTIKSKNDIGWNEEKTRIQYDGARISIAINYDFLCRILHKLTSAYISADCTRIKFTGEQFEHLISLMVTQ